MQVRTTRGTSQCFPLPNAGQTSHGARMTLAHSPCPPCLIADFLRLAGALNLLTAFELGDIFLSTTASMGALGALSYAEFLQALVRCALVAYSKTSRSTIAVKLSSLLLRMREARARRRL